MDWLNQPCQTPDTNALQSAQHRQSQLTKPPGALGQLEDLAIRLAALQGQEKPQLKNTHISVFAADHGVAESGVSAFPQEVTVQMVMNFLQGGAAISVLAKHHNATLEVIDVGIKQALPQQTGLIIQRAGDGTANSSVEPAMNYLQLEQALAAGYDAVERALLDKADLFIGGEMGIGNTTAATALYCALLQIPPEQLTGAGTGLDADGINHKTKIIQQMLDRHEEECGTSTLPWLRCVGGFEIAALAGAYIHAAQSGLPVLVDGFICTAAAAVALRLQPDVKPWLFLSHTSAEQGHQQACEALGLQPLLNLGLRLGEGSGAAIALPILQEACVLHNQMATFEEAAVAGKL